MLSVRAQPCCGHDAKNNPGNYFTGSCAAARRGPARRTEQQAHSRRYYYPAVGYSVAVLPQGSSAVSYYTPADYYYHAGARYRPAAGSSWCTRQWASWCRCSAAVQHDLRRQPAHITIRNETYYSAVPGGAGYAVVAPPPGAEQATVVPPAPPPAPATGPRRLPRRRRDPGISANRRTATTRTCASAAGAQCPRPPAPR